MENALYNAKTAQATLWSREWLFLFLFILGVAMAIAALNPSNAAAQTISAKGVILQPTGDTSYVSNAYVSISTPNYSSYQSAYTNSSGAFTFYDLPAGTYSLRIDAYNTSFPDPPPQTVVVDSGTTNDLGIIRLKNPNVSGKVTAPDGVTGSSGATVYLTGPPDSNIWEYTTSNSSGIFNFYLEAAGSYSLSIYPSGSTSYFSPYPQPTFTYVAGTTMDLGNIPLKAANVTGIVTEPNGTTAVPYASVTIYNTNYVISKWASTATNGTFSTFVPAGTYTLEVNAWNANYPNPLPQTITVPSSGTLNVGTIKLRSPNISGIVTKLDGTTPVANASINLSGGNGVYKYTTTNGSGEFGFILDTTGTYKLEVWANDSQEANPAPTSFSYTAGDTKTFTGADKLTLRSPSIKGKVLNPDGTVAQYASISITSNGAYSYDGNDWTSTDINGLFKSKVLPAGTYTINVQVYNSSGTMILPMDTLSATVTTGATNSDYLANPIQLQNAKKTIKGTITKSNGAKVTNAYINAWRQDNGYGWTSTQTNSNGEFTLVVGQGKWQVSVSPTWNGGQPDWGYFKSPQTVSFSEANSVAESQTMNFEVISFDAKITGRILNPDGTVPGQYATSVSAWSAEGIGSGGYSSPDSSGNFEVKLAAGTYKVDIWSSSSTYAAPDMASVTLSSGETRSLGDVKLVTKNEFIKGKVTDSNNQPLSNQYVNAWKATGSGWAWAQTDSNGNFTLTVTPGTWYVDSYPNNWSNGTQNGTIYAKTETPQKVAIQKDETKENINIQFAIADATISGTVQDQNGNTIKDLYSWVEARNTASTNAVNYMGSTGAQVTSGTFTLKVPAGTYKLGVFMPWGSEYTASSETTITVTSGQSYDSAVIKLMPNNATITGSLLDKNGNAMTDVWGSVFADNGAGGRQWAQFQNGTFSFKVSAGVWRIGYWIDPRSGYISNSTGDIELTAVANSTVTQNLTLLKADSTIRGTAYDPDGNPMKNAWISADTELGGKRSTETQQLYYYGSMFQQGTFTDADGKFSIKVPEGEYFVSATLPPDLGFMNPKAQKVVVDANNAASIELQFRKADATISGSVTLSGTASPAYVWGWSEEGGISEIYTTTGSYQLNVTKGEVWHIGAIYETGSTFYKSDETVVDVPDSGSVTKNLILENSNVTIPPAENATFDSTKAKVITLTDGTEIVIPAFALASSGNVTVTATPKAQVASTPTAKPIALAYDLVAKDSSNQSITSFNSDVTITLVYTDAQLTDLGITEDDLVPMYYDETSGTWQPVANVVVDKDNNKIAFTANHFTSFAITTGTVSQTTSSNISLTLSAPRNNSLVDVGSLRVSGKVSDPTAAVSVQINANIAINLPVSSDGSFSRIVTGLTSGSNTVRVDAIKGVDSATVSRTVVYRVDGLGDASKRTATGLDLETVVVAANGGPQVRVFDRSGNMKASFFAFGKDFRGTFSAITADIDGDGDKEIVAFTSQGFGPQVRVFTNRGALIHGFFALDKGFRGGIVVNAADINGDGKADLIVRPMSFGGPQIRVYTYNEATKRFELLSSLWAYHKGFRGKIQVTFGDIDGNGTAEIIVSPLEAGGPNVRVYQYNAATKKLEFLDGFFAYQTNFTGGVTVAVGDVDGDGIQEIITAPVKNGGPNIRAFTYNTSTKTFSLLDGFMAYQETYRKGVRIQLADMNGDGSTDIITAPVSGGPHIRVYTYNTTTDQFTLLKGMTVFQSNFRGGVEFSVGDLDGDSNMEIIVWPRSNGGPNLKIYEYNATNKSFGLLDGFFAYSKAFRGTIDVKVVDMDGDGDSEIVASPLSEGGANVRIYDYANGNISIAKGFMAFDKTFRGGARIATGTISIPGVLQSASGRVYPRQK